MGLAGKGLQSSRFELKYMVPEEVARGVRDFVLSYLEPDEFQTKFGGIGYPVCSLYLDDSGLMLYDQTIQGHKNRFKLRIRFYDDDPSGPAFLEIKRRDTDVIKKKRAPITREGALLLLDGGRPTPDHLYGSKVSISTVEALDDFCNLRDSIAACGCTFVYYQREAYVSPDSNQLRVTFDRLLEGGLYEPGGKLEIPKKAKRPKMDGVVLELKFTDRFPNWMRELAQIFNLQKISVPKYVKCVEALGLKQLSTLHQRYSR